MTDEERPRKTRDRRGDRRKGASIRIPVWWSTEPFEVKGQDLMQVLGLALGIFIAVMVWFIAENIKGLNDAWYAQVRSKNIESCALAEPDPTKRRDRWDDCFRMMEGHDARRGK